MKFAVSLTTFFFGSVLSFAVLAKSVSVNVFAIPSDNIEHAVANVSAQLKQADMQSFYEKGFPVHITLYLTSYDDSQLSEILADVESIASTQSPFPLTAKGFTVTAGNWVFVDAIASHPLQRLADTVTLTLEPRRNTSSSLPEWVKSYPNKKAAFERYGSPNVFQNFEPHMTLLAAETSPLLHKVEQMMHRNPPLAEGSVQAIGVGIADDKGQVSRILGVFPLSR